MTEYWREVDHERATLADQLTELSEAEWNRRSLCDKWLVRDVAAHLSILKLMSVGRSVTEAVRARGNFDRMIVNVTAEVAERHTNAELVTELRSMIGSRRRAPGTKPTEPLLDILVHGQDIMVPLGRERPIPTAAGLVALERVWTIGFPFHAKKKLRGLRLKTTDADWSGGDGELVEGPLRAILLLAAGRVDGALPDLSGDGVQALKARMTS
ncbi:maleylpyruvate isomerase family mycothiol-dependent enzyme [Amycolatopsis sp. NPDC059657]|uniref:maleylpyruvate isomerase family mycothiol-dependent enzyme n=1 Tax=Amycolatopsis sp. NPDC059657 TaxID=3346899 RepID=UPI00366D78E9